MLQTAPDLDGFLEGKGNELHYLYSSRSIIRMIKSGKMRWTGHVARKGEEECIEDFCGEARRKETTSNT
jgi:hypothetical protein